MLPPGNDVLTCPRHPVWTFLDGCHQSWAIFSSPFEFFLHSDCLLSLTPSSSMWHTISNLRKKFLSLLVTGHTCNSRPSDSPPRTFTRLTTLKEQSRTVDLAGRYPLLVSSGGVSQNAMPSSLSQLHRTDFHFRSFRPDTPRWIVISQFFGL